MKKYKFIGLVIAGILLVYVSIILHRSKTTDLMEFIGWVLIFWAIIGDILSGVTIIKRSVNNVTTQTLNIEKSDKQIFKFKDRL